jgi:crotonobetainyl-CoA:carnitine CoA-transferase CaiB-like acyl-CoA transferase
MGGVLEGVRVLEVSMWAMVPATGAILAEWGADVLKVEGPHGDPVRGLVTAGITPDGPRYTWEMWNRGKRAIALDLNDLGAHAIVHQLAAEADVFLTSILPAQRAKLGIDLESIRAANPSIIYASGSGVGSKGPEANKGGYDSITFWARSGAAASATPPGADPVGMPAGAFGDATSGMALAGGVSAALVKKARTGEGSVVEASLLGTAMWAMQMWITGARAAGLDDMPRTTRQRPFNVLVNTYLTADDRWIALCMLQADQYWPGVCHAIDRDDLIDDARFADAKLRAENVEACVAELEATFRAEPLDVWTARLATQDGQWDVLKKVSEVLDDPQVEANQFAHRVPYADGHELSLVQSPVQFDQAPATVRPAPEFGADTDAVLEALGWDSEAIIEAKIKGTVV